MMMEEKFAHKVQQALIDPPLIRAAAPPLRQFQRGHGQHERQRIFSDQLNVPEDQFYANEMGRMRSHSFGLASVNEREEN